MVQFFLLLLNFNILGVRMCASNVGANSVNVVLCTFPRFSQPVMTPMALDNGYIGCLCKQNQMVRNTAVTDLSTTCPGHENVLLELLVAAALVGRNKFDDPARVIYTDSMRKPAGNGFLLGALNGGNGYALTNGSQPRMNISVNPLTEVEADKYTDGRSSPHVDQVQV